MKSELKQQCQELLNKRESKRLLKIGNWVSLKKFEKRMAIALDIISRVITGQIDPITGYYVSVRRPWEYDGDKQAKPYINSGELKCQACALGSTLISLVSRENKCTIDHLTDGYHFSALAGNSHRKRLGKIFSHIQLSLIESAFEIVDKRSMGAEVDVSAAIEFGKKFKKDSERLVNICLNIVENKGTFKP